MFADFRGLWSIGSEDFAASASATEKKCTIGTVHAYNTGASQGTVDPARRTASPQSRRRRRAPSAQPQPPKRAPPWRACTVPVTPPQPTWDRRQRRPPRQRAILPAPSAQARTMARSVRKQTMRCVIGEGARHHGPSLALAAPPQAATNGSRAQSAPQNCERTSKMQGPVPAAPSTPPALASSDGSAS